MISVRICEGRTRVVVTIAESPYWAYLRFSHVKTADRVVIVTADNRAPNQEGFMRSKNSFVDIVPILNAVAYGDVSAVVSFRRRM